MTPVTVSVEALNKIKDQRAAALAQVKDLETKLQSAEARIKELEARVAPRKKPATQEVL